MSVAPESSQNDVKRSVESPLQCTTLSLAIGATAGLAAGSTFESPTSVDSGPLKGKKAIVTGGTRGIGRAIANLLVEEGCDVGICARSQGGVEEAIAAFKNSGVKALGSALDVADGQALKTFVETTAGRLGGLDIFVSNVSALGMGNDEESWRKGFEIDIMGTVRGCEAALPSKPWLANPMGRMGTPEEVANAVVFLASARASFITGANLICDGSITQRVQY